MIDRTPPIAPMAATHELPARPAPQPNVSERKAADSKTSVTLSSVMTQLHTDDSRDVNHARVAEFRAALDADQLPFTADEVAQSMLPYIVSPKP